MVSEEKSGYRPFVAYSTNVHRGETLDEVYQFLREYTIPIKEQVFGKDATSGLELRLGIGSTRELLDEAARARFGEFLRDSRLDLFSINAFPLLDFHAERVKERVYKPSWVEEERTEWTSRISRVFADLLPEGITGSVSTLGGCYRGEAHDEATFRRLAAGFLSTLETLLDLERQGKTIVLAVEPEPETTFETTADVIDFFERRLLPLALERWKDLGGREAIESALRRLFTVNVDTCHLSVLFEDQVESLRRLESAGISVGKLHVTSAVSLERPFDSPEGYQDLRSMDEPRYFHQFAGADRDGRVIWRDLDLDRLPPELERGKCPDVVEIRSHFHVPLYLERYLSLATTREDTARALRETVGRRLTDHLVLETYTWPIIAGEEDRRTKLLAGIAREFEWLLRVLEEEGV